MKRKPTSSFGASYAAYLRSLDARRPPSASSYNHLTPLNPDMPPLAKAAAPRRPKRPVRAGPPCVACRGTGKTPVPDFRGVSLRHIARLMCVSVGYLSELLNQHSERTRENPTLKIVAALRDAIEEATGTWVSLDAVAAMITRKPED